MVEIEEVVHKTVHTKSQDKIDQFNDLMQNMERQRDKWQDEEGTDGTDEKDHLLTQAINMALEQGRGWGPGEKEAYLEKILDDDFIPPLFATTPEEVEKSGLTEAFTSLIYDGENPTTLMIQFRKKGNDAYANGQRNVTNNMQYYRDAINHWYEALAWAQKIEAIQEGDLAQADTDDPTYNGLELDELRSTICSNLALAHLQLSNWGHVRTECQKAVDYNKKNIKAWYRLAKAYQNLKLFEEAGNAIDSGLEIESTNKELLKLQKQLADKVRRARQLRQERERKRAERVSKVKAVWKHCQQHNIWLGRHTLVADCDNDDDMNDDDNPNNDQTESRWHNHLPHSGMLPTASDDSNNNNWSWPCLFVYPSHNQSDFIANFGQDEMLAMRMAQVFPELDDEGGEQETAMPWDDKNEFTCSQLAMYFEVHEAAVEAASQKSKNKDAALIHPDTVEYLPDQASCMRFYESSRALKGDEGPEMAEVVRLVEQRHLGKLKRAWKKEFGSLWNRPDPCPVVRVHPAMTLHDVLTDSRMVVPNFLVTLIMFPEKHPAHEAYLKEHKCVGILQPENKS